MLNHNQKFNNGQAVEGQFQMGSSFFLPKVGASDNSNNNENTNIRKSPIDNSRAVFGAYGSNFLGNIQTAFYSLPKKEKMATMKLGWVLFNLIGFPVYTYSLIYTYANGEPIKFWVLLFFGVVFMIIESFRRYEGYRGRRIDNDLKKIERDEKLYQINKAHKKDGENNKP